MDRSDLNQSYAAYDQTSTMAIVVELSSKNWLALGTVPGVKRQPRKKVSANAHELLTLTRRAHAFGACRVGTAGRCRDQTLALPPPLPTLHPIKMPRRKRGNYARWSPPLQGRRQTATDLRFTRDRNFKMSVHRQQPMYAGRQG